MNTYQTLDHAEEQHGQTSVEQLLIAKAAYQLATDLQHLCDKYNRLNPVQSARDQPEWE